MRTELDTYHEEVVISRTRLERCKQEMEAERYRLNGEVAELKLMMASVLLPLVRYVRGSGRVLVIEAAGDAARELVETELNAGMGTAIFERATSTPLIQAMNASSMVLVRISFPMSAGSLTLNFCRRKTDV